MWGADVPASDAKVLLLCQSYKAETGDLREILAETVDFIFLGFEKFPSSMDNERVLIIW